MIGKRYYFGAVYAESNDKIYVTGGDGGNRLKSCEYYDLNTNKWTPMAHMNVARREHSCCLFNQKYIYVFRGYTNNDNDAFHEVYDMEKNTWTIVDLGNQQQQMLPKVDAMTHQISATEILIAGGYTGGSKKDVLIYNTTNKTITKGQDMPQADRFLQQQQFHIGDTIYGVGYNSKKLFAYKITTGTWTIDNNFKIVK